MCKTMLVIMSLLENWCKGEGVDLNHAIIVKRAPIDTTIEHIEETQLVQKVLKHLTVGHVHSKA
uniref:Paraneoplastic antigen Ma-like N-terminal domain-containing protein n=1 Tax=Amphilophus citrinellus TaxID=61819 RepID=A0A3Q0RJ99_AMPCI